MHSISKRVVLQQDQCLILQPEIVKQLGRSAAIFLQQLHYWISADSNVGVVIKHKKWIYNSTKSWAENIKILSEATVKRAILTLKKVGIVQSANLNTKKSDKTLWYTINYEKLKKLFPQKIHFITDHVLTKSNQQSFYQSQTKMSLSLGQTEQIINKETEITSENKTIFSEGKTFAKKKSCSQQVNFVKKESELKNKNNIATELLDIWNQTIGQGSTLVQLTKKRAQHLVAAFKYRFESSLEKWKQFCQQITTSDFLMGKVKETFKASLDWVLKFDVIQRIFEGDFGIKPKDDASNSRLDAEKLETTLRKEIDSSDDPVEVKDLREKILRNAGGQSYHNWFRTFPIIVDEQGRGFELQAPGAFQVDWIESNYGSILRAFNIHVSDGSRESSGLRPRALISGHNLEEEKLETLREEIDSGDEIDEAKDLRREILHKLGGGLYQAWFRNLTITIDEQQSRGVRFYAQNQFVKDWIETHYLDKLRSLTSQVIHIFWGEACG